MTLHPSLSVRLGVSAMLLVLYCGCHGGNGTPAPSPSFTLTASPSGLSIPAGGGGFATVTLTRTGSFADPVTLSLDGAPPGVVGTGTVAASAQTGQLSILVGFGVAPQSLDALRVKGKAGSLAKTTLFKLVIAAPLPVGQIGADLVQANGGTQRAGVIENAWVAREPVTASTSKDTTGNVEVRHGFQPSATPN